MALTAPLPKFSQADLCGWRLIEDFRARLAQAARHRPGSVTWSEPKRLLQQADYLSLFLFGLLNPVVQTMRGLCAASHLQRVQKQICGRPVSLGSFSEAQHVLEPELLSVVLTHLSQQWSAPTAAGVAARRWLLQDGSLFEALPRMYWALWRRQGRTQSQVRLHLSLDLSSGTVAHATITAGKTCERAVWRQHCQRGEA